MTSTGPSTSPTAPNPSPPKPAAWSSYSNRMKNTRQDCLWSRKRKNADWSGEHPCLPRRGFPGVTDMVTTQIDRNPAHKRFSTAGKQGCLPLQSSLQARAPGSVMVRPAILRFFAWLPLSYFSGYSGLTKRTD